MTTTEAGHVFTPIRPNPYIVGNPVRNPKMFFGRETEFELVKKRFSHSRRGLLMVFCGERRSGKTSILLQILQGRLGPEFIPALIDMQAMAVESEAEFLLRVSSQIIKQAKGAGVELAPPHFENRSSPSGAFREFVESFVELNPDRKLVLLFDEYELFEDKIEDGALGKDVLLVLSSLMENLPTFVIFTGSQHLDERKAEYWRILEKTHEHRRVSYLHPDDAVRLIRDPLQGRATYPDDIVQRMMRLTAGQPFYTQAICLNLVDVLNDKCTTTVTGDMVDMVVEQIVEYPFPQMTFLWDSLERDQRLTLAILAETLEDGTRFATADELVATLKAKKYPLELTGPAIATAQEALFKQELLIKDKERTPGFAFRMDLWRLWIHRMHSVWQVMHEEGLEFRSSGFRRSRIAIAAGLVLIIGVGAFLMWRLASAGTSGGGSAADTSTPPAVVPMGYVSIEPHPADARIDRDGATVAVGPYRRAITAGHEHEFMVHAAGYADSVFVLQVAHAETASIALPLRPRRGRVRFDTDPPGAELVLNGQSMGTAPIERTLLVPDDHVVEAALDGYHPGTRTFRVLPDTTIHVALRLSVVNVDLSVVSSPDGAEIFVDGTRRGVTPIVISDLHVGSHRFEARLTGYVPRDTTVTVDTSTNRLRLTLLPEPPGILMVRGDRPARIYIDGAQVGSGELPSSGDTELPAGQHTVEVVFRDGTSDEMHVDVVTGERVELRWREQRLHRQESGR